MISLSSRRLLLSASSNSAQHMQLPTIRPGALAQLQRLQLEFRGVQSALPPSWSNPAVLPSLVELTLMMQLEGSLPAEWAQGFQRLTRLRLVGLPVDMPIERREGATAEDFELWRETQQTSQHGSSDAVQGAARDTNQLPPEWAAGFPKLEVRRAAAASCLLVMLLPCMSCTGRMLLLLVYQTPVHSCSCLQVLQLINLGLTGSLPRSWQDGGFPSLNDL